MGDAILRIRDGRRRRRRHARQVLPGVMDQFFRFRSGTEERGDNLVNVTIKLPLSNHVLERFLPHKTTLPIVAKQLKFRDGDNAIGQ